MSKKKQEDIIEEVEEGVVDKVGIKKRVESIEKRKRARKKDAIERWSGLIFLGLVLLIGLLLSSTG